MTRQEELMLLYEKVIEDCKNRLSDIELDCAQGFVAAEDTIQRTCNNIRDIKQERIKLNNGES